MNWPAVVIAVHIVALGLLVWAIRGRVPRAGVRCPKCWYDMAGVPEEAGTILCPECGRRAPLEAWARRGQARRHSYRSRRAIIAAILIQIAGAYWWHQRRPGYESWTGLMPDWALMRLVRQYPHRGLIVSRSLEERFEHGDLSRGHMEELCERFLALDPATAQGAPYTRPRWVAGIPVIYGVTGGPVWPWWQTAGVDGQEFWPMGQETSAAPDNPGDTPRPLDWRGGLVLGHPARLGHNEATLTLENAIGLPARRRWTYQGVWARRTEATVRVFGVESITRCMTPVDNAAARQWIVDGLSIAIHRPLQGDAMNLPVVLAFGGRSRLAGAARPGHTTAIRVTIEHGGVVLAEFRDHEAGFNTPLTVHHVRQRSIHGDAAWDPLRRNGGLDLDLTGVIVRIVPDPQGALADFAHTAYWSGEIVLDAGEVIEVEPPIWPEE